MSEVMSY